MEQRQPSQVQYGGFHLTWSPSEKKIARQVFDRALHQELGALMTKAKKLAADATTPDDLWALERYLTRSRQAIDKKYDFRYSQLIFVLAKLLHEGLIGEDDVRGLREDKVRPILSLANFQSSSRLSRRESSASDQSEAPDLSTNRSG
jgi:hypothetical protein